MPRKIGGLRARYKKNQIAKREYKKYYQQAKAGLAQTTRKRESAQRKARAVARANAKYGMTSQERKDARMAKLKELGDAMQGVGGSGGGGFDVDALLGYDKPKRKTTRKKTKSKKRKTTRKASGGNYVVINGVAYPTAVSPTTSKKPRKRKKSSKKRSQSPTDYYTSMF